MAQEVKYLSYSGLSHFKSKLDDAYAPKSHTHNYLPLSGGTLTGTLNSQNIIPTSNSSYNLGSSILKWKNVYAHKFICASVDENIRNKCLLLADGSTVDINSIGAKGWYSINPYFYGDAGNGYNQIKHFYTKIATFRKNSDEGKAINAVLRFRLFEDVNYPSYGEYVLRLNWNQSYGRCVTLVQSSASTRQLEVYVTSESSELIVDDVYHVWVRSDIEWSSSLQFKIEYDQYNYGNIYTSDFEQIIVEPSNIIGSFINNGVLRIADNTSSGTVSIQNNANGDTYKNKFTADTFIGNLSGNVTGNVTGNLIGNATNATNDSNGTAFIGNYLRKVSVPNNAVNDFNTFENMTLTGRGDPASGCPALANSPWSGSGPVGGYGVLTYLWSNYGMQMAWGYNSNKVYIRNKYYGKSGTEWTSTWDSLALTSDIPASLQNPYSLTIKGNGTTIDSYDGSSAKTVNITPASIGAAATAEIVSITNDEIDTIINNYK